MKQKEPSKLEKIVVYTAIILAISSPFIYANLQKGKTMVNNKPIGKQNLLFRRTTNRYAKKGTISSNQGYINVARDTKTGQFAPRTK